MPATDIRSCREARVVSETSHGIGRHALVVFGLAWALTSGALLVLHSSAADASATVELVVLTAANLAATAMRFTLLRLWVFARPADRTTAGDNQPATTTAASCGP